MFIVSNENIEIGPDEVKTFCVDFSTKLLSTETLTGTPTIAEVDTTVLTITSKAVLAAEYTDPKGDSVAAGKGLVFTVSGAQVQSDGSDKGYEVNTHCATTLSLRPQIICRLTCTKRR